MFIENIVECEIWDGRVCLGFSTKQRTLSLNIKEHLLITTTSNTVKLTLLPQAGEFRDCCGILYYNVFDVKGRGILHGKEWLAVRDKI